MKAKISDFVLAETILKGLCRNRGINFVDISISIKEQEEQTLFIGDPKNVAHTIYLIIDKYIENEMLLCGIGLFESEEEKRSFLINLANTLRSLIYIENTNDEVFEKLSLQRLYQKPIVWLLMKDIVCPIFDVPLKNIKLVSGLSACIDIARYYEKGEVQKDEEESFSFIFVNEIDNHSVQNAFIFVEALRAYGLNPVEVLKYLFESEMYDKLSGLLELSLEDKEKIDQFICVLMALVDVNLKKFIPINSSLKMAQNMSSPMVPSQWWFLGLTEGMLGKVRGMDWTTTKSLQPYMEKFWNKVEKIRQKRGGDPVPFEVLLRLKAEEDPGHQIKNNKILQGLLSSNRVW